MKYTPTILLVFFLLLGFVANDVGAQQRRRRPPRGETASAPVPEEPLDFESSLRLGKPPAFWEIDANHHTESLRAVLDLDSIAPPVPAKVLRYAVMILDQYDDDGDGILSESEWRAMPGTPQTIDLDGDLKITLDELIRHIAVYSEGRTIHRMNPVPKRQGGSLTTGSLQLFRPLDVPTPPKSRGGNAKSTDTVTSSVGDLTADNLETGTDAKPVHEDSIEKLVAEKKLPEDRKYYSSPEELRGIPAWFILRDKDGDGQLTMLEFAPQLTPESLALFGRLDKNGDGLLTIDEVRNRGGGAAPENLPTPNAADTPVPSSDSAAPSAPAEIPATPAVSPVPAAPAT